MTFKFDTSRRNPDLKVERYAYSVPSEELARFALFRRRCDYSSYSSLTKLIASLGKMIYSTLETRHPASSVSLSVSSLFTSLSPFLRPLYLSSSRISLSQAISPFFSFATIATLTSCLLRETRRKEKEWREEGSRQRERKSEKYAWKGEGEGKVGMR